MEEVSVWTLGKLKVVDGQNRGAQLYMGAVCVCGKGRGVGGVEGQRFSIQLWWGQTKGKEKWNRTG